MSTTSLAIIALLKGGAIGSFLGGLPIGVVILYDKTKKWVEKVNKLKNLREEFENWKKIKEFLKGIEINDYSFKEIMRHVNYGIEDSQNRLYKEIGRLEFEKKEELCEERK